MAFHARATQAEALEKLISDVGARPITKAIFLEVSSDIFGHAINGAPSL